MPYLSSYVRWAAPLLAGLALLVPARSAVSISDVSVTLSPSNLVLSYRLNEPATSVSIVVNATTYPGTTTKGLNTVNLPTSTLGQSANITVTAPAEAGTGGAVVVVPFTQDPAASNYDGIAWVKRADSPYYGHLYTVSGRAQTVKKLSAWAADGTLINEKNLAAIATSGSWPFGVGIGQEDPNDFVYVANRSNSTVYKFSPGDLALQKSFTYTPSNCYPGMTITRNTSASPTNPWNVYLGGNRNGTVIHVLYDGDSTSTSAGENPTASSASATSSVALPYSVAVDTQNKVLFKAQAHDSGVGPISEDDTNSPGTPSAIQKWTSTDAGDTWLLDATWGTNFRNDIGADASASALGVALDAGFDSNNLAASKVWVCVTSVTTTAINKLYHVRADDGHVIAADTIDLTQVTVPAGSHTLADQPAHFIDVSPRGNIALQIGQAPDAGHAFYWGVLAPNTAGPTSTSITATLQPKLGAVASTDRSSVGNSGSGSLTFIVVVTDPGAQAGTATVTGDFTQIGGSASASVAKTGESADHKSATFSTTVPVPTSSPLGSFDIPFTVTVAGKTLTTTTNVNIYAAYTPSWQATVDGPANSSPAANGSVAYIGTEAGTVYAFNAANGSAVTTFGSAGKASVGEAVHGSITSAFGRLYVSGTSHVFCLNSGTGAVIGTSPAIPSPSTVLAPASDATAVYVGGGDNKIHKLNAKTLAEITASADLGAQVHAPAIGISTDQNNIDTPILLAGTEPVSGSGQIVMLKASDLTQAFAPILDPKGAVRGSPVYSVVNGTRPHAFAIGGASGLWGINADTGTKMAEEGSTAIWATDPGENGNPYATATPVDANVSTGLVGESLTAGFVYATRGDANTGGDVNILVGDTGIRVSYGGLPAPLTPPGSGFAAGSGPLYVSGTVPGDTGAVPAINLYIGSDTVDQRFFALDTLPQDFTYTPTAAKKHIFDPRDTVTFGSSYAPGGFLSMPVRADDKVVVGSTAGRVYGFPTLMDPSNYVQSVTPANGATGVAASAAVSLVFTQDMSTATIDSSTIKLLDENGQAVDATPQLQGDNKTVLVTPTNPLTDKKTYIVVVDPSLAQPFSSSFFVGTPPSVRGDVNGDLVFNAQDVKDALKMAAGLLPSTATAFTALNKTAGSKITVEDAVFLDRVLNGKSSF